MAGLFFPLPAIRALALMQDPTASRVRHHASISHFLLTGHLISKGGSWTNAQKGLDWMSWSGSLKSGWVLGLMLIVAAILGVVLTAMYIRAAQKLYDQDKEHAPWRRRARKKAADKASSPDRSS